MIKIVKRKSAPDLPIPALTKRPPSQTVTGTVNDWIAERRKHQLDEDNSSRQTIAGWAGESEI